MQAGNYTENDRGVQIGALIERGPHGIFTDEIRATLKTILHVGARDEFLSSLRPAEGAYLHIRRAAVRATGTRAARTRRLRPVPQASDSVRAPVRELASHTRSTRRGGRRVRARGRRSRRDRALYIPLPVGTYIPDRLIDMGLAVWYGDTSRRNTARSVHGRCSG